MGIPQQGIYGVYSLYFLLKKCFNYEDNDIFVYCRYWLITGHLLYVSFIEWSYNGNFEGVPSIQITVVFGKLSLNISNPVLYCANRYSCLAKFRLRSKNTIDTLKVIICGEPIMKKLGTGTMTTWAMSSVVDTGGKRNRSIMISIPLTLQTNVCYYHYQEFNPY
jgi:hypothetical protein